MVRNASSVTRCCEGTFTPSTFIGNTALGCNSWVNSFLMTFRSMTPRILFRPPLVLPEQAPKNIHAANTTHVTCGQVLASSLKRPVVVMNETTWKMAQDRKSTRLNSSHANISYAVFCLKKKLESCTCAD